MLFRSLVEDTWKIAKNGYGYHDVDAGLGDADPNNGRGGGGSNGQGNGNGNGQGNGNGSGDKPTGSLVTSFSTVVKQFVVDYTSPTFEPLMEHEVNGLDYRYVYGNDRLSVNITGVETSSGNLIENGNQIRLYYHMDYLGTTDYLTSPVSLKVTSWTHYNEWGEITHNAVLKTGKRELDLVKRYATHDYDAVLGMYYAKARFYDAENRRFASVDPVKGEITNPLTMVQYIYAIDCPLVYVDLGGEQAVANTDIGGGGAPSKPSPDQPSVPGVSGAVTGISMTQLIVTADQVRMRTAPSLNSSTVGYLNKGTYVTNLNQTVDKDGYTWRKVKVNGKICWVADHYLKTVQQSSPQDPATLKPQQPSTTKPHTNTTSNSSEATGSNENNGPKPGYRFVGFGIQLEVSLAGLPVCIGAELIFYTDAWVRTNKNKWYNLCLYAYAGASISGDNIQTILENLAGNPSALTSSASLANILPRKATGSISVFAIIGNETFTSPNDYAGPFDSVSATIKRVKGFVAVSSSCFAVGIGYDTQFIGCGYAKTEYVLLAANISDIFDELARTAQGIAKTKAAEYLT